MLHYTIPNKSGNYKYLKCVYILSDIVIGMTISIARHAFSPATAGLLRTTPTAVTTTATAAPQAITTTATALPKSSSYALSSTALKSAPQAVITPTAATPTTGLGIFTPQNIALGEQVLIDVTGAIILTSVVVGMAASVLPKGR